MLSYKKIIILQRLKSRKIDVREQNQRLKSRKIDVISFLLKELF